MKNKKLIWGIIVVIVIIIIVLILSLRTEPQQAEPTPTASTTPAPTIQATVETPKPTTIPTPTQSTTLKSYTDPELKVTVSYPADWQLLAGEPGPNYSFWFTHKVGAEMGSIFRVARTDGCRPDNSVTIDGQRAYDSGWQSLTTLPSRKICLIDKKILIDLTARNTQARIAEDAILSSFKFTN